MKKRLVYALAGAGIGFALAKAIEFLWKPTGTLETGLTVIVAMVALLWEQARREDSQRREAMRAITSDRLKN
jgi:uncharacterized membrane protein